MRAELRYGLLLSALALVLSRFAIFPAGISDFFSGAFAGFGIFLLIVNLLPKNIYDNLLYRKWIASLNH